MLDDARIKDYPDAELLESRYDGLLARVPDVEAEVARRKLAAAVEAATTKNKVSEEALQEAVKRLKRDPDDADFKVAREAAKGVADALDEAEELEDDDPAYAKHALAVRKRLADQKKKIARRWIDVRVGRSRKDIGVIFKELSDAVRRLRGRDVTEADFFEATKIADQSRDVLDKGEDLLAKDIRYAKFVSAMRKKLSSYRDQIKKQQHLVTVQRQKARVEEARAEVKTALRLIKKKDASAADFKEASAALEALSKALAAGDSLLAKDTGYARYAVSVRKQHEAGKRLLETRQIEVAIATAKAEIETARFDLGGALGRLKSGDPVEADFAEATKQADRVSKMLDARTDLVSKDRRFMKYITDVRKSLAAARQTIRDRRLGVEVQRQRARVKERLTELKSAVVAVAAKGAGPDDFSAAMAAVEALEKTLDAGQKLEARDRSYGKYAIEKRKLAARMRLKIRERREEVAIANQKAAVGEKMETLKEALRPLRGFSPSPEQFSAAQSAIQGVESALAAGEALETRPTYARYAVGIRKELRKAMTRASSRKQEIELRQRKLLVEDAMANLDSAMKGTRARDAGTDSLGEAENALKFAKDEIAAGVDLETKDRKYRKFAFAARQKLQKHQKALEAVRSTIEFREGAAARLVSGLSSLKEAQQLPAQDQPEPLSAALAHFKGCREKGSAILASTPNLSAKFQVGRSRSSAKTILKRCTESGEKAQTLLDAASAVAEFERGPAKSLVSGLMLLADAENADEKTQKQKYEKALSVFETCLVDGKILTQKHPKLLKTRFDVDGQMKTARVVVGACKKQASAARRAIAMIK